jgi:hypothetical protein
MKAMNPFIFVVVSIVIASLFRAKRYFNLFRNVPEKTKIWGIRIGNLVWTVPLSSQPNHLVHFGLMILGT